MDIKSFIRPPTQSCVGTCLSLYRGYDLLHPRKPGVLEAIKAIAKRILVMFVVLSAVAVDVAMWSFRTVTLYSMFKVGIKNHFVNLISLIAATIFSLTIPFGGKPKADQTRPMFFPMWPCLLKCSDHEIEPKLFEARAPNCCNSYDWADQMKAAGEELPKAFYLDYYHNSVKFEDFIQVIAITENFIVEITSILHKFLMTGESLNGKDRFGNTFLHRLFSSEILMLDHSLINEMLHFCCHPPQHKDYPIEAAILSERNLENCTSLDLILFRPVYTLISFVSVSPDFVIVDAWRSHKKKLELEMASSFQAGDSFYKMIVIKLIENGAPFDFDFITEFKGVLTKILDDFDLRLNGRKAEDIPLRGFDKKSLSARLLKQMNPYSKLLGKQLHTIAYGDHNAQTRQNSVVLTLNYLYEQVEKIIKLKEVFQAAKQKRLEFFPDVGLPPQVIDVAVDYL